MRSVSSILSSLSCSVELHFDRFPALARHGRELVVGNPHPHGDCQALVAIDEGHPARYLRHYQGRRLRRTDKGELFNVYLAVRRGAVCIASPAPVDVGEHEQAVTDEERL